MSYLSDSQMLDSGGGAFADELERSDSFIPTSISKEEAPTARICQGSLSANEIDRMLQELVEPVTVEIRDRTLRPSASQQPHFPFSNPAIIATQDVVVSIPIQQCGVMLPFYPFVKAILRHYDVSPFQLTPNNYLIIIGFYAIYMEYVQGKPTMEDFRVEGLIKDFFQITAILDFHKLYTKAAVAAANTFFLNFEILAFPIHLINRPARPVLDPARREIAGVLEMTFLKQAPTFNRKPKVCTAKTSLVIPRKRKSDAVLTQVADSSKKQHKTAQDKGKKVVIDPIVKAHDFIALQDKFMSNEFVSKAFVLGSKELDLLRKENSLLQDSVKKLKLEVTTKGKDIKDLGKAKEQAEEKIQSLRIPMYFALCVLLRPRDLGENIFLEDAKNANAEEVPDCAASKVADDPSTHAP
uniref:Transposase (putative) gypsy type domain-containing protein n=1 Tax=Cannabis sativa TaxID=3483 RepID=A0A803PUM9_CANSA